MKKLKKYLSEFKYKLSSKWSSFTYIFRRPYYRLRLFKRFYKTDYWGAWEMCNPMLEYPFEMFCEFYEQGGIENTCYVDSPWKEVKEEMDYLYKWYTVEKQNRENEIDYVLEVWSEHHVGFCKEKYKGRKMFSWNYVVSNYGKYLFKMLGELEKTFDKEQEDCLIRLIKIRNFMWS